MYISDATLDDLLRRVYLRLLKSKNRVVPTRGAATELAGVLLQLTNPRARLSRTERRGKPFGALGELLWYLAGNNTLEFIRYYLPGYADDSVDGNTIYGGYGPRLFNMRGTHNQVTNVVELLKNKPDSRRAVIQIFDASDLAINPKEIPCTCTLQFLIRERRLHMFTTMRSNDVFLGLPHDVFAFTMLQEIIARTLGVGLGPYKHAVGSLHLYSRDVENVQLYLDEGWQERIAMPPMPEGDPWPSIRKLLKIEKRIRTNGVADIEKSAMNEYWSDLARLLQIFRYSKDGQTKQIALTMRAMSTDVYNSYIRQRQRIAKSAEQADLSLIPGEDNRRR